MHEAAITAARLATEISDTGGPIIQFIGEYHVLSVALFSVDQAIGILSTTISSYAEQVTLVADTYYAIVENGRPDAVAAMQRGDLAARYELGDPTVSDAINVVTVHRYDEPKMTTMPYARVNGVVEWKERIDHGGAHLQGRVYDAIARSFVLMPHNIMADRADEFHLFSHVIELIENAGLPAMVVSR